MDDSVSAEMPCSQPVLRNAPLDAHPLRGRLEPAGREGHAVFLRHGHPSRPQDLMPPEIPKDCLAPASLLWQTLALLHNCIVAILINPYYILNMRWMHTLLGSNKSLGTQQGGCTCAPGSVRTYCQDSQACLPQKHQSRSSLSAWARHWIMRCLAQGCEWPVQA